MDIVSAERVVTVQKGRLEDAGRVNAEFWAAIPPQERLALVWEMVLEYRAWRTPDAGDQPRLQRSVLRVERR